MDVVKTSGSFNITDFLVLEPDYSDLYKLYSFEFCINKQNRLTALQVMLRKNRKASTELKLLEHGDFTTCTSKGSFALAKDDVVTKLTV